MGWLQYNFKNKTTPALVKPAIIMGQTIAIKIDVSKITKARLFKGEKGTYLDAVLFLNEEADQYGNHGMIVESVTKEERAAGTRGPILGNVKVIGVKPAAAPASAASAAPVPKATDEDLPF